MKAKIHKSDFTFKPAGLGINIMKAKIQKSDFTFKPAGLGVYLVTYTSPQTGKSWSRLITDMELIDATKNTERPAVIALNRLKSAVKNLPARERWPIYKLKMQCVESQDMRDELDWFLENKELIFVASHKRYSFPTNLEINFSSFDGWENVEKHLEKQGYKHVTPVYMLDHSWMAFALGKFEGLHGRFDSGQIGFLASTKKGRKWSKALKLYKEFIKDLQDYSNNFVQLIELTDEKGEQIECFECFDNKIARALKCMKRAYKRAKIVEVE